MRDLDRFKKFLGPLAAAYTDAQLEQLRREFDAAAELLLDIFVYTHGRHGREKSRPSAIDTPRTPTLESDSNPRRPDSPPQVPFNPTT